MDSPKFMVYVKINITSGDMEDRGKEDVLNLVHETLEARQEIGAPEFDFDVVYANSGKYGIQEID